MKQKKAVVTAFRLVACNLSSGEASIWRCRCLVAGVVQGVLNK